MTHRGIRKRSRFSNRVVEGYVHPWQAESNWPLPCHGYHSKMRCDDFAATVVICLFAYFSLGAADTPKPAAVPNVAGEWTGNWGAFDPASMAKIDKAPCKGLQCTVIQKDGIWQATFVGECGGVYYWVGRASEKDFVAFYTSSGHVLVFQMGRKK